MPALAPAVKIHAPAGDATAEIVTCVPDVAVALIENEVPAVKSVNVDTEKTGVLVLSASLLTVSFEDSADRAPVPTIFAAVTETVYEPTPIPSKVVDKPGPHFGSETVVAPSIVVLKYAQY